MLLKAQNNCKVTKKNIASIIENKLPLSHQALPFGSFRLLAKYDFINTKHIDKRRFEYNLLRLAEDAEMKNKELSQKLFLRLSVFKLKVMYLSYYSYLKESIGSTSAAFKAG
ncbi:MAG: hypothetical protein ACPG5B_15795 [Chitinophagales bacterium]